MLNSIFFYCSTQQHLKLESLFFLQSANYNLKCFTDDAQISFDCIVGVPVTSRQERLLSYALSVNCLNQSRKGSGLELENYFFWLC